MIWKDCSADLSIMHFVFPENENDWVLMSTLPWYDVMFSLNFFMSANHNTQRSFNIHPKYGGETSKRTISIGRFSYRAHGSSGTEYMMRNQMKNGITKYSCKYFTRPISSCPYFNLVPSSKCTISFSTFTDERQILPWLVLIGFRTWNITQSSKMKTSNFKWN